jgi:cytochrome c5
MSKQSHESHEGPIKTPKQLVLTVVLSFALIIAVIVLLVTFVGAGKKVSAGTDVMSEIETAARIEKVGGIASIQDAGGGALRTGEEMFKAICSGCHATGVSGAPKFGDAAAWGPRIKTGYDALLNSALKGKGAMPAQNGAGTEVEIGRAVVYMANNGGAKFDEPKAPAAAASEAK